MSFVVGESIHRQVNQGRLPMEGRRSLGGVGAHRPSPTEDRGQLPGGFDEDGGHRVASAVSVSCAWADCGEVAKTIEGLGRVRVTCPGTGRGGDAEKPFE